jgi:hypothetical protein
MTSVPARTSPVLSMMGTAITVDDRPRFVHRGRRIRSALDRDLAQFDGGTSAALSVLITRSQDRITERDVP